MRLKSILVIGTFCLLLSGSTASAAQKNCDDVLQKQGAGPYQKCQYDNQEDILKQQVAAYKNVADAQKQPTKTYYETLINAEEYSWKDTDLQLQWEEQDRKLRIDQMTRSGSAPEDIQQEKNSLAMIQKIRSLTSSSHSNKMDLLKKSEDETLKRLDASVVDYELELRRNSMPSL